MLTLYVRSIFRYVDIQCEVDLGVVKFRFIHDLCMNSLMLVPPFTVEPFDQAGKVISYATNFLNYRLRTLSVIWRPGWGLRSLFDGILILPE